MSKELVRVSLEVVQSNAIAWNTLGLFTSKDIAVKSIKLTYSRLTEVSFKEYPDKVVVTFNSSDYKPQGFVRPTLRPNFGYLTIHLRSNKRGKKLHIFKEKRL